MIYYCNKYFLSGEIKRKLKQYSKHLGIRINYCALKVQIFLLILCLIDTTNQLILFDFVQTLNTKGLKFLLERNSFMRFSLILLEACTVLILVVVKIKSN
jgi:hypothetical protein